MRRSVEWASSARGSSSLVISLTVVTALMYTEVSPSAAGASALAGALLAVRALLRR
jgi:hypothetical protein